MSEQHAITLWQIEDQLDQLIEFRDQATTLEEVQAADQEIRKYVEQEVRKCDGIARYLTFCSGMEDMADVEIKRLQARKKAWMARRERLEYIALVAMQHFNLKKIDGRLATLAVANNPPAVTVTEPSLLPPEFQRCRITMDGQTWKAFLAAAKSAGVEIGSISVEYEPKKADIATELKKTEPCPSPACRIGALIASCPECNGTGIVNKKVAGAHLQREVRLKVT